MRNYAKLDVTKIVAKVDLALASSFHRPFGYICNNKIKNEFQS